MSRFVVTNSGLKQFFSGCPAKYTFYKNYNLSKLPPPLAFGIEVHKAVEEGMPNPQDLDYHVYEVASKLLRMAKKMGYEIIDSEINHIAPLTDDIWVAGRVDVVAELEGDAVLVDWKTGNYGWKTRKLETGEIAVPQAESFQGVIYTTPPIGSEDIWPDELHYLLAPSKGKTAIHKYHRKEEDVQRLIRAATLMKDAADRSWFPKIKGYQCHQCDWMHACWKTTGWEKYYIERD